MPQLVNIICAVGTNTQWGLWWEIQFLAQKHRMDENASGIHTQHVRVSKSRIVTLGHTKTHTYTQTIALTFMEISAPTVAQAMATAEYAAKVG